MPTATLVIVTFNSSDAIPTCADALAKLSVEGGYELVIVDNASHDDSVAVVTRHMPHATLITNTMNRGFAAAVNQGVESGSGRIVATLNPDTIVASDWLQSLITVLDKDSHIGIVGSAISDFAGVLTHTGGNYHPLTFHTQHHDAPNNQLSDVPYVTGAGIAMRRSDWQRVGGFDEGFFPAYFEDVDLCLRVRAMGLRCVYQPQARLQHQESSSTGKYSGPFYFYYHRNRIRLALRTLDTHTLLTDFVMAEAQSLTQTDILDRLIALSCYRQSMPSPATGAPDSAVQQHILALATRLKPIQAEHRHHPHLLPDDVLNLLGIDRMRAELYDMVYGALPAQSHPDTPQVNELTQPLYQLLYGTARIADVRVRLVGSELVQFVEQMLATRNSDVFWQTHHISRLTSEIEYLRHIVSLSDVMTIENTIRSALTSHLLITSRSQA
ncbi:MAG: glycosyltransferase family 2 protein [Roseiflexaceae bacterium]|jgi:GT2 family glycosyltransferase